MAPRPPLRPAAGLLQTPVPLCQDRHVVGGVLTHCQSSRPAHFVRSRRRGPPAWSSPLVAALGMVYASPRGGGHAYFTQGGLMTRAERLAQTEARARAKLEAQRIRLAQV